MPRKSAPTPATEISASFPPPFPSVCKEDMKLSPLEKLEKAEGFVLKDILSQNSIKQMKILNRHV
jgi:hypothetical protein